MFHVVPQRYVQGEDAKDVNHCSNVLRIPLLRCLAKSSVQDVYNLVHLLVIQFSANTLIVWSPEGVCVGLVAEEQGKEQRTQDRASYMLTGVIIGSQVHTNFVSF